LDSAGFCHRKIETHFNSLIRQKKMTNFSRHLRKKTKS